VIPQQEYTAEFKTLAVQRVQGGQTVGAVAWELGLVEQTVDMACRWRNRPQSATRRQPVGAESPPSQWPIAGSRAW